MPSPQPEKSKAPVKTEQRGRVLGIGGICFKSADRDQMREWYSKHPGLADHGGGAMLPWREHADPRKEHVTVWTVFPDSTDYIPATQPFNYIVDDLDALLDRPMFNFVPLGGAGRGALARSAPLRREMFSRRAASGGMASGPVV